MNLKQWRDNMLVKLTSKDKETALLFGNSTLATQVGLVGLENTEGKEIKAGALAIVLIANDTAPVGIGKQIDKNAIVNHFVTLTFLSVESVDNIIKNLEKIKKVMTEGWDE